MASAVRVYTSTCDIATQKPNIALVLSAVQSLGLANQLQVYMAADVGTPFNWTTVSHSIAIATALQSQFGNIKGVIVGENAIYNNASDVDNLITAMDWMRGNLTNTAVFVAFTPSFLYAQFVRRGTADSNPGFNVSVLFS